jgi:hypothetical protein
MRVARGHPTEAGRQVTLEHLATERLHTLEVSALALEAGHHCTKPSTAIGPRPTLARHSALERHALERHEHLLTTGVARMHLLWRRRLTTRMTMGQEPMPTLLTSPSLGGLVWLVVLVLERAMQIRIVCMDLPYHRHQALQVPYQ